MAVVEAPYISRDMSIFIMSWSFWIALAQVTVGVVEFGSRSALSNIVVTLVESMGYLPPLIYVQCLSESVSPWASCGVRVATKNAIMIEQARNTQSRTSARPGSPPPGAAIVEAKRLPARRLFSSSSINNTQSGTPTRPASLLQEQQ